jgi:DNA-binding NarL/FixJ family response regulator
MKKEIKDKEKELLSIALQVEQKNKLINHFYQKIKDQKLSEEKKNFDTLLSEIKTSLNIQKDIDLFTEKFTELHHDFIGKVKTQFPKLTFKEIKLLSFLKIGLSTKQIASMQNITPAAIHKMRYRIKKKINLDKKSSLDDFIVNL